KREREDGAGLTMSGSKRSRMVEAGAVREGDLRAQPEVDEEEETQPSQDDIEVVEVCPITDKNEKPFRLMDMPPEIRIEIYRACLTRPFDILLSKEPKPIERVKERAESIVVGSDGLVEGTMSQESEEEEAILGEALQSLAASP